MMGMECGNRKNGAKRCITSDEKHDKTTTQHSPIPTILQVLMQSQSMILCQNSKTKMMGCKLNQSLVALIKMLKHFCILLPFPLSSFFKTRL